MTTNNARENNVLKQDFTKSVTSALVNNNILDFQRAVKQRLQDNFATAIKTLQQLPEAVEIDYETQSRIDIEAAAKSFGGNTPLYDQGVLIVDFDSKDSAHHFSAWLDDYKTIESYELNILTGIDKDSDDDDDDDDEDAVIDIDFDAIKNDDGYNFEFIVYLHPDIVTYSDDDDFEDDFNEQLSEVKRIIKVSTQGKNVVKKIKMKCDPGFKWNNASNSCQKISGAALATQRKAVKKRLITMKSEGPSLQKRINIKTKKAMKFRRALGLS